MIRRSRPEPPVEILERMRQPVLADTRAGADTRRNAAIAGMIGALRAEGRRRKRLRVSWLVASAALVFLVAGAGAWARLRSTHSDGASAASSSVATPDPAGAVELRVSSGVAVATRHGVSTALSSAASIRIDEGDAVRTGPDARAALLLPRGVSVELSRATKASILSAREDDQKLALDVGETHISVPRPGGPHTFSVTTPDARVVVHGTEFTVHVDEIDGSRATRTSVSVMRGAVSVSDASGERLLQPGDSWSANVREAAAAAPAPATPRARASNAHESSSSLAEQNKLFQAALDARRAGDDAGVLRAVDDLFARYPETTLGEEARLVRFRALRALHRNRDAAREAKRYLSAHPDAPAADEARRALLESTTATEPE